MMTNIRVQHRLNHHLGQKSCVAHLHQMMQSHGLANIPAQGGNFHPTHEVTPPNLIHELATPPIHSGDNSHPTPEMQEPRKKPSQVSTIKGEKGKGKGNALF
ncbi:PREDICTED: uncharacterized protein LOC104611739 isoform X2 [Nelumbo nucifera]|uniref:Uncharacterized protein LOC104611739 isoform X2 n=1 Tax=Nelumbo nucifera TaxID=4432 RepID=A0A1U8BK76_NELNU|nr:PREDICTED: uncharacterized protein LOC104611739 isoform X2 [Nelumbo nucifera]